MKIQDVDTKQKLILRLRRIEGQVHGVQEMLEDERDCREIMQQLSAVHAALQGASRIFLQEYTTACLIEMEEYDHDAGSRREKRARVIQEMIAMLDKAP
jgi:DNA-binding FrmR family transcriptional regulator